MCTNPIERVYFKREEDILLEVIHNSALLFLFWKKILEMTQEALKPKSLEKNSD